jgi:transcriptional regulator with XRE-family HTH domain
MNTKGYRRATKMVDVTVGESVRIIRELQGLSQNQLSRLTNIPQSTISAIENERVNPGVERGEGDRPCAQVSPRSALVPSLGCENRVSSLTRRGSGRISLSR